MLLQLTSEQTDQIMQVFKEAQTNSNWTPLALILGLCITSLILLVTLIIYIWKSTKIVTENKLLEHSEIITMLSKNSNEHSLLINKLETMSEVHDREIKDLKSA